MGEDIQTPTRAAMSIAAIATNNALAPKASAVINKKWQKPVEGFLMINVDGCFDETTRPSAPVEKGQRNWFPN